MTASYLLRLVCFSLAAFCALNLVSSALLRLFSGPLIRFAGRMRASSAARLLFAARIAPSAAALLIVCALCIPSYLWLEPQSAQEEISGFCIFASALTLATALLSFLRTARAVTASRQFFTDSQRDAERASISGIPVLLIDSPRTTALAGISHPAIVFSRDIWNALRPDQRRAAVLHEQFHEQSRDNLKRLLLLLAPAFVPLAGLEKAWKRFAEWAADDHAVAGDRLRSIALAETLVCVAKIGVSHSHALATSLLGEDLEARIARLLDGTPLAPDARELPWRTLAIAFTPLLALCLRPSTFDLVHRALEKFTHV